jgi:hypothetical protein
MIGEDVLGSCVLDDSVCTGRRFRGDGTSAAAPQIAGLVAYLWSLEPTLHPAQIRSHLLAHFDGRWVDAFAAVSHLPAMAPGFPALRTLVDLDNNQIFDDADIRAVLAAIDAHHSAQPSRAQATPDFARTDLNGDGFSRSDTHARFSFRPATTPRYGTFRYSFGPGGVDVDLQETAVSDLGILCGAAYSGVLIASAETARDALLRDRCGPSVAAGDWNGEVSFQEILTNRSTMSCNGSRSYDSVVEGTLFFRCSQLVLGDGGTCFVTGLQANGSSVEHAETPSNTSAFVVRGTGSSCDQCSSEDCHLTGNTCFAPLGTSCAACVATAVGGSSRRIQASGPWPDESPTIPVRVAVSRTAQGPGLTLTGDLTWPVTGTDVQTTTCPTFRGTDCDGIPALYPCTPQTTTAVTFNTGFRTSSIRGPLLLTSDTAGETFSGGFTDGYDIDNGSSTWRYIVDVTLRPAP